MRVLKRLGGFRRVWERLGEFGRDWESLEELRRNLDSLREFAREFIVVVLIKSVYMIQGIISLEL